jgi:hypothetical protein
MSSQAIGFEDGKSIVNFAGTMPEFSIYGLIIMTLPLNGTNEELHMAFTSTIARFRGIPTKNLCDRGFDVI